MPTFTNQREILINVPKPSKDFIAIDRVYLQQASQHLTPAQTIIYLDLAGNKNGYIKDFSPAYYQNNYGISIKTAQRAFQELLEQGYLEQSAENANFYTFSIVPNKPQTK